MLHLSKVFSAQYLNHVCALTDHFERPPSIYLKILITDITNPTLLYGWLIVAPTINTLA